MTHSCIMLSKRNWQNGKYLQNNGNRSDSSDKSMKPSELSRGRPLKPPSKIETSRNWRPVELARGISVIFGEENSHIVARHRDVNFLFTVMNFAKLKLQLEENENGESFSMPAQPFRRIPRWGSINGDEGNAEYPISSFFPPYLEDYHPRWMIDRERELASETPVETRSLDVQTVRHQPCDNELISRFCYMCNTRLKEDECIYMFKGRAFCSSDCRNEEVVNTFMAEKEIEVDEVQNS